MFHHQGECAWRIRNTQTYHKYFRGFDDIGYNFLIGGDGRAYEGRGWNKQGAHTKGFNEKSIGIAFSGIFKQKIPPDQQLRAAQQLIKIGVETRKLDPNYRLYGACQMRPTDSSGTALIGRRISDR